MVVFLKKINPFLTEVRALTKLRQAYEILDNLIPDEEGLERESRIDRRHVHSLCTYSRNRPNEPNYLKVIVDTDFSERIEINTNHPNLTSKLVVDALYAVK